MTKSIFTANRFIATSHSNAEEKARFCAVFAKFVLSGFARRLFRHDFYRRLSNIFGHIANYDDTGFWEVWFSSPDRQRQFVRRIHEWVPVGDPHFCWVDVERELKSWATREADAIETVLTENEWKSLGATVAENARRAALADKTHQAFTVMAKSSNIGAFGHRQYLMVAQDGSAFKVLRSYLYSWDTGQVVNVPLVNGEPDWCGIQGVECPERVEDCPVEGECQVVVSAFKRQ
jgi:hypothetical protein